MQDASQKAEASLYNVLNLEMQSAREENSKI
jgi:hypothetical protein